MSDKKQPDFLGLGGHGSDVSSSQDTSDSDEDSSEQSVDSAELRAAEAQARLKDFGEAVSKPNAALPSALDAFQEVAGKPAFLDPEATRPLAVNSTHGLTGVPAATTVAGKQKHTKDRANVTDDFDISQLAPPIKGQQQQQADKRGPQGAVIEGKAKRYKLEESTQQYTPAQIAMMGGNVDHLLNEDEQGKREKGPSTKAMPVQEFLDKGLGGAQLPRKYQDRKDKEKSKRAAGQSTHSSWKSEAEMVLRQQYD